MDHREIMQRVFAKLGHEKQLLEYHRVLYELVGVVMDFISDEGVSLKLSRGRNFHPLCDYLRRNARGIRRCNECDQMQARIAAQQKTPQIYTCYAGFTEIVVPLFDRNGLYLGCMTAGQFYALGKAHPTVADFTALANELGLPSEELFSRVRKTIELSDAQIAGLMDYLKLVGNLLVSTHGNLMFMESVNTPDRMQYIQTYIHQNYMKPLDITMMAKKFYLSPNYFSRLFSRIFGVTFNTYLNCYRVDKAQEMLMDTDLPISEIVSLTGFGSISQFNRVFRNVVHRTPRAYRNAADAAAAPDENKLPPRSLSSRVDKLL